MRTAWERNPSICFLHKHAALCHVATVLVQPVHIYSRTCRGKLCHELFEPVPLSKFKKALIESGGTSSPHKVSFVWSFRIDYPAFFLANRKHIDWGLCKQCQEDVDRDLAIGVLQDLLIIEECVSEVTHAFGEALGELLLD